MPRRSVGRAMELLVQSVVKETVKGVKRNLPSPKQLQRIEERLRDLDRRVSSIARKTAKKERGERKSKVGRPRKNPLICSVRNCKEPARATSLCSRHYQQQRRSVLKVRGRRRK